MKIARRGLRAEARVTENSAARGCYRRDCSQGLRELLHELLRVRGVVAPDREAREAQEARKAKRRFGWKEEALSMIRLDRAGPLDVLLLRAHAFSAEPKSL